MKLFAFVEFWLMMNLCYYLERDKELWYNEDMLSVVIVKKQIDIERE